jgi:hypothetical protein
MCQANGAWSAQSRCAAISAYCPPIDAPVNGQLSLVPTSYIVGTQPKFSCSDGFTLSSDKKKKKKKKEEKRKK